MKIILGIFIGILSVVVVIVLVAGYFGFVPGVSKIFGSDKPRDLGVTFSSSDNTSAIAKAGVQISDLPAGTPPAQSLVYAGTQTVSFNITGAEASALLNDNPWPYNTLTDCQVRFNTDGSTEISGILLTDRLGDWATAHGYSVDQLSSVVSYIQKFTVIQNRMPFDMIAKASVVNGVISFNVSKFELGRLSIPVAQINGHELEIVDGINNWARHIPGLSVKNLSVVNGQLHFDGTLPKSVQRSIG